MVELDELLLPSSVVIRPLVLALEYPTVDCNRNDTTYVPYSQV